MKERIFFKISKKMHTSLMNFSIRNFRNFSESTNFITNLYLENPEMFDFSKRIWTKEKKNKLLAVSLDKNNLNKITEITKEKDIKIHRFLLGILDVYFIDHPEYFPSEEKALF